MASARFHFSASAGMQKMALAKILAQARPLPSAQARTECSHFYFFVGWKGVVLLVCIQAVGAKLISRPIFFLQRERKGSL